MGGWTRAAGGGLRFIGHLLVRSCRFTGAGAEEESSGGGEEGNTLQHRHPGLLHWEP